MAAVTYTSGQVAVLMPNLSALTDELAMFLLAFAGFVAAYRKLAPAYATRKRRAWVITTIASAFMTLASAPFVRDYVSAGGRMAGMRTNANAAWGRAAVRIFQAYLTADLMVGALEYREHVGVVTGWAHHTIYVLISDVALRYGHTHILCLCFIMELPTFILAAASLHPRLRSDVLFALAFFTTRLALHLAVLTSLVLSVGAYLPAAILACVLPLHASWFRGCVRGFSKRRQARRHAAEQERTRGRTVGVKVQGKLISFENGSLRARRMAHTAEH